MRVGEMLLSSGGEIWRVEDTMKRILQALELETCHVYVLSNGIFAFVEKDGKTECMLCQVPLGEIDLEKITALNQLSRDIVCQKLDWREAEAGLEVVGNTKDRLCCIKPFFCGLGCGAFSYLRGGSFFDFMGAVFVGITLYGTRYRMNKRGVSKLVIRLLGSMQVASVSLFLLWMGLPASQDVLIISGTIPLFPGIAFTTSIRDFFNGDYLSGVIHLVDALLSGLCVAAGAGIVLGICQTLGVI